MSFFRFPPNEERVSDDDDEGVDKGMMMARVRPSGVEAGGGETSRTQSVASLKFDEQAQFAEDAVVGAIGNPNVYINEGEEGRWIKRELKCRECRWFVPAEDSSDDEENLQFSKNAPIIESDSAADDLQPSAQLPKSMHKRSKRGVNDKKCQCGCRLSEHSDPQRAEKQGREHPNTNWDPNKHSSPVPTNAFGEIEFVGYGDKVAKYVRVDHQTNMSQMTKLMTEKWKMEHPNLLISVTGGAKNFLMRGRLKDAFRRGLMKAALSTGAWIVTGGTNAGVMKHVGEAVRDYGLTAEGRVIAIGIAPWGCVQNKNVLIDDKGPKATGKWPALYRIELEQKPKESFLDPNHTHFILVDNGTQRQFATEIEFRAKLEKEISQWTTGGSDAVHVPVALLVLEGGPGTLKTVMNAIKNNTPAIVIKGSGKCADVLAHAAQNITEKEVKGTDSRGRPYTETMGVMDEKLKADIKTMVEQTFGVKDALLRADWVEKCVAKPHLLTIFELESVSGSASSGVDLAILKALLKANKDQVMDQLKLALAWNRIDIAKSEIFTDERPWPTGALDDMMMSAIQLNRVDFVDLFLDNGVSLKDFLTVRRLLTLYNQVPKNCLLYTLLLKIKHTQRKRFSLEDVGYLLQDLLGDYFQPDYLEDDNLRELSADTILNRSLPSSPADTSKSTFTGDTKMTRPAQDLFLWAVLMNQQDLAKLFWREGNESTAAALVANSLLKAMRNYTNDSDMRHRLQTNADEFENLSIGVINNCYLHDEQKAQDVLIREMNNWGKATCVLIAMQADNKRFISQTACQSLLNSIWMGKLSQDNGLIRLIPSMLIFPLILAIVKFKDDDRLPSDTYTPRTSKKATSSKSPSHSSGARPALKREMTEMNLVKDATQLSLKGEEDHKHEAQVAPREETTKRPSKCEKIQSFYTTPVVIFILNCLSYLVFLSLYSYILVVQLSSTFHFLEGILIVWVFTIFVEEMRQLVTNFAHSMKSKVVTYISDSWNILDMITIFLFSIGMILRFIPDDTCFEVARVVLALNLVSFFFRILHIFSVNKELGPKLVMIRRMIQDLMWFVVILMVFIGAYAIASEAILYPETELSWKLLYYLPRKAYWQIYGELFLEEIEGDSSTCTSDPALYSDYGQLRCPSTAGKYLVPVLTGVYVLMTNVLLLNLLIAMFSYTFNKVQENTDVHWYFQRFNLIHEYYERPWLPPPFVLFIHMYMMFAWCVRRCNQTSKTSDFRKRFQNHQDEKQLVQWENIIADTYLTKVEATEADSIDGKLKLLMQRLETVQHKLDNVPEHAPAGAVVASNAPAFAVVASNAPVPIPVPVIHQPPVKQVVQMPPQLEQRLGSLEEQITSTGQALNWIMQNLREKSEKEVENPPQLPPDRQAAEKKEARKKKVTLQQHVSFELEKRLTLHVVARSPIYPNSFVGRYPVPDEMVSWDVEYEDYDPVSYTADNILANPPYADTLDLLSMPVKDRLGKILFNDVDRVSRISRVSFEGEYRVKDGLPLNPKGRTGMEGRGMLGRWGPNIAGDPLVTRWMCTPRKEPVMVDGKPVLQFVAVKRTDNRMWAIPGAIALPGEQPWDVLFKYFKMEALGSLMEDPEKKADIDRKVKELSEKGVAVYKGYADDARNTDNAWLETCVMNYHDDTGEILDNFELRAGAGTVAVSWVTVSSKLHLHGSHLYFLKLTAEMHGAMF